MLGDKIKVRVLKSLPVILGSIQNCIEKSFNFLMKSYIPSLFVSLYLLILSTFTFSQNSQLQNFNTKEGLPQSQVYDIVQDSIGYLWIATQGGGLAKFDGDKFTVFNEKDSLQSNFINSLLISNDSLFIGTFSGLSIHSKGKFSNYQSPKINKILSIDGNIILATEKGIFRYHRDSIYPIQSSNKINQGNITDIAKSKSFYMVSSLSGIWALDRLEDPEKLEQLDTKHYTTLLQKNEVIYASSYDAGLKIIRNGKITKTISRVNRINEMTQIGDYLWLATDNSGVVVLTDQFVKDQDIDQGNGLLVNQARKIFQDKQKNIWIGTSGGGLFKLTQNDFQHYDRNSGLKGNRTYSVHSKHKEVWISSSEKGITKIDSLGIQQIYEDNGFLNVKAKTITSDEYDNVWVGTEGKGILIFSKKYIENDSIKEGTKFDSLDKKIFPDYILETDTLSTENGLPSNYIKKLIIENRSVWVATYESGIVELIYGKSGLSYKVWKHYNSNEGIKDPFINDVQLDSDGKLWYTTRNGNIGFIQNGKARSFHRVIGKDVSITTLEIRDNNIFIGTLGDGVYVLNKENPREIKKLNGNKELNSKNIYQLIFDLENNLWAGTEKGVNKIVLDENNSISNVFYFGKNDGFLGIETCQNAVDIDPSGNIWFGTMNGLTKYIPSKSQIQSSKPSIFFENIEVAYKPLDTVDINKFNNILQLEPLQNHLSFQFKSVDINHPKGIEYKYSLNENESPWTSKDFIDYGNLKDGEYKFSVKSRNIDWIESDPIQFKFFIDKPMYQKFWFLALVYSSLGLTLLISIFLIYKRIKQNNKRKLEQLEMENHLLSLEQKALQLQMNPHFIFNVLNGIKAMGYEGDTEQMNSTINTFATLLRSILNSSRQDEVSLSDEVKTLTNYLSLEQKMATKPFDFNIQISTGEIDPEEILIPPMLIQPFAENSVKHAFSSIKNKGKIYIEFKVNKDFLCCQVKDNGIGINSAQKQKKHHHPSTALKVTKERIESLTKDHRLEIKEDNGTIVTFRLPLNTDY